MEGGKLEGDHMEVEMFEGSGGKYITKNEI
jgi:hypothetical protein